MGRDRHPQHSQLFTLRLWKEELGDGQVEVRCQAQHVLSGETRSFLGCVGLREFLCAKLQEFEVQPNPDSTQF
jgi:hypothetical protein